MRLLYLDGDPVEVGAAPDERRQSWQVEGRAAPERSVGECLLSSPLRTIVPWQDR